MELNYSINTAVSLTITTNLTSTTTPPSDPLTPRYWALCLSVLVLTTLFGNVLVVMAVKTSKQLQSVTNYLIVSLAIADITVGSLVMPLAVYVEVMGGLFLLDEKICDAWVALDVLACTASILNMTAISIDRFLAIRHAVFYTNRLKRSTSYPAIMIALSWCLSFAIALPIALGANYTEHRIADSCFFFNPMFSFLSSVGSFFIPTVAMVIFYWLIFKVIRKRAILNKAKRSKKSAALSLKVESSSDSYDPMVKLPASKLQCTPSTETSNNVTEQVNSYHINETSTERTALTTNGSMVKPSETSYKAVDVSFKCSEAEEPEDEVWVLQQQLQKTEPPRLSTSESRHLIDPKRKTPSRYSLDRETQVADRRSMKRPTLEKLRHVLRVNQRSSCASSELRRDRKENRERKATITLVVVLCVFLVCWIPFFVMNNLNAICLEWNLNSTTPACEELGKYLPLFIWLGYINSTFNPLIYAVLNMEYRKAFKRLLFRSSKK